MIIRYPTGLYKTILPNGFESGNVTYTISTQSPPQIPVRLVQLPVAEELLASPEKLFSDEERRERYGELIFTISQSTRSVPGSNVKPFELGEILEFETTPPEQEIFPLQSPDSLEIRHDTNVLDLSTLGLTESEILTLKSDSEKKQKELEVLFNQKNTEAKNLDTDIVENQKAINETNKTIDAVRKIYGISNGDMTNDNVVYQKLLSGLIELESERETLISSRNSIVDELKDITDSIISVSELVR